MITKQKYWYTILAIAIVAIIFISGCIEQPVEERQAKEVWIEEKAACRKGQCVDISDEWFLNECRVEKCSCIDCNNLWECWNAWTGGNCKAGEQCRDLYGTEYREAAHNVVYKIDPTKKTEAECVGISPAEAEPKEEVPKEKIPEVFLDIRVPKTSFTTGEPFSGEHIVEIGKANFPNVVYFSCEMVGQERKCEGAIMGPTIFGVVTEPIEPAKYSRPIDACLITETFSACGARNFKLPGTYILKLAVYDCAEVEKILDKCDAGIFRKENFQQIQPFSAVEKTITVAGELIPYCQWTEECADKICENCKKGHYICWTSAAECVECFIDQNCIEGYYCDKETYKCVKK